MWLSMKKNSCNVVLEQEPTDDLSVLLVKFFVVAFLYSYLCYRLALNKVLYVYCVGRNLHQAAILAEVHVLIAI